MQRGISNYLFDIKRAGTLLMSFIAEKSFADYQRQPMLQAAVERKVGIVGEAMIQMARIERSPEREITSVGQIVALRNDLIHNHCTVSPEIVWEIIQEDLPILLQEVGVLLKDFEEPPVEP